MAVVGMEEEGEREAPLHGEILETIVSLMRTVDLLPASHVSKAWRGAVSSTLRRSPRLKPWLFLHIQSRRNPSSAVSVAYDPHSRSWVPIRHVPLTCPLQSSHPSLLFGLSPSTLSISSDPFGATWRDLNGPRVWRRDPIVALIDSRLVVAGGVLDFEDDAFAVEACDLVNVGPARWETCESLPEAFRGSTSSMWLSVATSGRRMYVLERTNGLFSWFDRETGKWGCTCVVWPDPALYASAIAASGDRLVLAGASGDADNPKNLTLWEVNQETLDCKEMGRMPPEMVAECFGLTTKGFSMVGDFGYVYNLTEMKEAFFCEFGKGKWERIGRPEAVDKNPTARIVFGCSTVGMDDLKFICPSVVK